MYEKCFSHVSHFDTQIIKKICNQIVNIKYVQFFVCQLYLKEAVSKNMCININI